MQDRRTTATPPSTFNVDSVLFAVFRHKAIVLICVLAGLIAGGAVYHFYPTSYESQAKLLVRYIMDRSSVDPMDGTAHSTGGDAVLLGEVGIIRSWDLAQQVAEAVGVQLLAPGAQADGKERAAAAVVSGLHVYTERGSNIILIGYENHKPELTTPVLNELVNRYFVRHLEVHRSAGAFDFVSQQTDQVRARLNQTEDALRALNEKVEVASIGDSISAINSEMLRTEEQLRGVDAEVAEQHARVAALEGLSGSQVPQNTSGKTREGSQRNAPAPSAVGANASRPSATPEAAEPGAEDAELYRELSGNLDQLRKAGAELRAKYTSEHTLVKSNRAEMTSIRDQMRRLERKFPGLVGTGSKGDTDLLSERAKLAGLIAKANELKTRLQEVRKRFKELANATPQIVELQRKKEMEEANLKYFQATLEKARIDEALDPSKIPNISAVQRPSPPTPVSTKRDKIAMGLAGGGLPLGVALAVLIEMLFNRTVKRGVEIESTLGVPVLLSIPKASTNGVLRLGTAPKPGGNGATTLAPWDTGHFIRPYSEAIRDRLGLYFELNDLNHKPKLIGVAGLSDGAGTSTLAAGLAAALSEVGDGKVLLVDVKLGPGDVHPFFKGRPALPLSAAIGKNDDTAPAAENLYLATVGNQTGGIAQIGLKKFFTLMPNLKASDFDYVIFDMPPVTSTSPTLGMSPFMDKILLVVEAEESNRDVVKRRYASLANERNNVSVVLNKTRSHLPKWIHGGIDS